MPILRIIPAGLAVLYLTCGAASAQSSPTSPGTTAPATNLDAKPGTLSDKLSSTGGVIKPTGNVDPDIHKPTPEAGTMPVLKPRQIPQQGSGTGGLY